MMMVCFDETVRGLLCLVHRFRFFFFVCVFVKEIFLSVSLVSCGATELFIITEQYVATLRNYIIEYFLEI